MHTSFWNVFQHFHRDLVGSDEAHKQKGAASEKRHTSASNQLKRVIGAHLWFELYLVDTPRRWLRYGGSSDVLGHTLTG